MVVATQQKIIFFLIRFDLGPEYETVAGINEWKG